MAAQPKVIIIVDDDASTLMSLSRLLMAYGFVTETFASAEALLAKNGICTATCLVLDIQLGGISGIELSRRLLSSGSTCPIIFMTAIDDDLIRQEAIEGGCIAYLRKPFGPNLLLEAIEKAAA